MYRHFYSKLYGKCSACACSRYQAFPPPPPSEGLETRLAVCLPYESNQVLQTSPTICLPYESIQILTLDICLPYESNQVLPNYPLFTIHTNFNYHQLPYESNQVLSNYPQLCYLSAFTNFNDPHSCYVVCLPYESNQVLQTSPTILTCSILLPYESNQVFSTTLNHLRASSPCLQSHKIRNYDFKSLLCPRTASIYYA